MSGCDVFLRSKDSGGGVNGIQNGVDGQSLSCCFNAVKEDGGGTGEGGLRGISRALKRQIGRRTDRRARSSRIWRALHGTCSTRVDDSSSGSIEAIIVIYCMESFVEVKEG